MKKVKSFLNNNLHWLICISVALVCVAFLVAGHISENGKYITLDGSDAQISDTTKKWIESANDALYRIMNEDAPTDATTTKEFENGEVGLGGSMTLEQVKARRLADGDNDYGRGWQCSKYTAYLATGRREYSTVHPDYGPVNGKDMAAWLVNNFGWKYSDAPVEGAIGSGGFNTLYGHTAMYLYSTGADTAMVNDANYVPLTVSTHNMDINGWVWVVPGDYTPDPAPTPTPTPVNKCKIWNVQTGDTMGEIMKHCRGEVKWGAEMNDYANHWYSTKFNPGYTVFYGWTHGIGYGLFAGDVIEYKE